MTANTLRTEILVDGEWIDAVNTGDGIRADTLSITRGRQSWSANPDSGSCRFRLDNRDGRWSRWNPNGPYYGKLRRNLPTRSGLRHGDKYLRHNGGTGQNVASTPDIAGVGGGSPTAPDHVDVTESAETTSTTTHTCTLPATIAAEDRLLLIGNCGHASFAPKDQGGGATDLDDWTDAYTGQLYDPWNRFRLYEIYVEDSAQATALAGSDVEFSTSVATTSSFQVIRTSGCRFGDQGFAWDFSINSLSKTYSSSPNPPSLTADWGADEHRWYAIVLYGSAGESVTSTPYITDYTDIEDGNTSALLQIATAHRTTAAVTEDPGAMTLSDNENWIAITFVYRAIEDTSANGVLDIVGDIDWRIEFELEEDPVELTDGGVRFRLMHKQSGADGYQATLYRANDELVALFSWRDSSGANNDYTTQLTGSFLPFDLLWKRSALRFTLDVSSGAGSWYTSDTIDGPWIQVGSDITSAGATSIKANDAPLRLGGNPNDGSTVVPFKGKIYKFELRDGIDGTVVANPDFTTQAVGASSFTDGATRVWTVGSDAAIDDTVWRFYGELSSLPLDWTVSGADVYSDVEASGLFRRLRQGNRSVESPLFRALRSGSPTELVQYWPLEESGTNAALSTFGAAVGNAPLVISGGAPTTEADTTFLASRALPTLGDASLEAMIDDYTSTDEWQIRWLQLVPDSFTGDDITFLSVDTTDMTWEIQYRDDSGGQLRILARRGATNVYTSAWTSFNATGKAMRMTFAVYQNGSSVDVNLEGQGQLESSAGGVTHTSVVAGSAGQATKLTINGESNIDDWVIGHITLQAAKTNSTELSTELAAYDGEKAAIRIARLLTEEGIGHRIQGDPDDTEIMGPQEAGSLIELLESCARTDLGILFEATDSLSVGYRTRNSMLDQDQQVLPTGTAYAHWWSTMDADSATQTIVDRAGSSNGTLGSSSASDANDPVLTGDPARWTPDGSDDYISIPYTPTFTPTTGELTVICIGAWDTDDATAVDARLVSFESADENGLSINTAGSGVSRPQVTVGGATTTVDRAPAAGDNLASGDLFAVSAVIDDGTVATHFGKLGSDGSLDSDGLSSTTSITGVGTITFGAGRALARADSNTDNASSGLLDVIVIEDALDNTTLNEIVEWVLQRNQAGVVELDYAAGEVAPPLQPRDDDQGFYNDVTVVNASGATARAVLDDGSVLSVSEPPTGSGRYDTRFDVNCRDNRLASLADDRLALSTVNEPRIDSLSVWRHSPPIEADASLGDAVLGARLGDLVTSWRNISAVFGSTQIRQLIQGVRETIGTHEHKIQFLTSSAGPWSTTATTTIGSPLSHSVSFRRQQSLATSGQPDHVLTALGYTSSDLITRADLDGILDDWVASTGGTTRNVTSVAEWNTAMNNALPGDLVRVTSGFDPAGGLNARGALYGISGANLTSSPDDEGGSPGLPIILTCADGVYVDDNDTASGEGVLDLQNCRHVWPVGFNVRDGQFGIRCMNWGGEAGFPAYVAYCNIENIGDAGLAGQGWFQLITSSGGTPPAGSGNEWGFSEHFVFEENTIDGTGVNTASAGEGIYTGRGGTPGWVSYCKNFWVRGNRATDWTSDGIDVKPGCSQGWITDNEIYIGHAISGAALQLLYVTSAIDDRDGTAFDADPEIYVEGNRVYDLDLTNTDASSAHYMAQVGLSGVRAANNLLWAHPQTGAHAAWRFRNEKGADDTEALAEFRADPTYVVNNTCWGDDAWDNGGYGAGPTAFPTSVTDAWEIRNNIVRQASPATGEVDAGSSNFIATVPAIGVAGDAEWEDYGNGSAFDLVATSALVGTGEDISDLTLAIDQDISKRSINKTSPNPGCFQPHPANI